MARNDWLSEDEKYLQAVAEVQRQMANQQVANRNGLTYSDQQAEQIPTRTDDNSRVVMTHATQGGLSNTNATTNFMVPFAEDYGTDAFGRVVQPGAIAPNGKEVPGTTWVNTPTRDAPKNDSDNYSGGGGGGGGAAPATPSYTYNPSYGAGSDPTMSGYYDPTKDPQYMAALQALQVAQDKPPAYVNSFEGQLADLYDQIVNRDKFKYDLNADMLYQQYKNQYMDLGQQAMRDTMGQAAGLTGGYGSTYAQNVGQQAYQSYLQRLNDVAPELYDRAFNTWLNEGNEMVRNYGLLQDRADDEYQKYLNDYNQWAADRAYAQDAEQLAYNRGKDQWATQYGAAQDRAKVLASYGDFSGYANIYGGDAANSLQRNWIYDNPDLALRNGLITQDEYNALVPQIPVYYGGGGGGDDDYTYLDDLLKSLYEDDDGPAGPEDDGGVPIIDPGLRIAGIEQTLDSMYANGANGRRSMTLAALEDAYKDPDSYMDKDTYIRLKEKYSK